VPNQGFGGAQGTCPPGTYLKTAPGVNATLTDGAAAANGNTTAGPEARLSDLHLIAPGGAAIELSTQFQPDTTVYGAMVAEVRTLDCQSSVFPSSVFPFLSLSSGDSHVHHSRLGAPLTARQSNRLASRSPAFGWHIGKAKWLCVYILPMSRLLWDIHTP